MVARIQCEYCCLTCTAPAGNSSAALSHVKAMGNTSHVVVLVKLFALSQRVPTPSSSSCEAVHTAQVNVDREEDIAFGQTVQATGSQLDSIIDLLNELLE